MHAHLENFGNVVPSAETGGQFGSPRRVALTATYRCAQCKQLSVARSPNHEADSLRYSDQDGLRQLIEYDGAWLPARGSSPDYPDVPIEIARAAMEAHACHSIGANRAAVQVARSVIEATAKARGITKGWLLEKIDALEAAKIILPSTATGCHEVRHLGNDAAHGDFDHPVTEEDADDVLVMMSVLLAEVFQQEARINRMKAGREARKQPTPPTS